MTVCIKCGAEQTHRVCQACFDAMMADHCQREECRDMAVHPASLCEWLDRNPEHRTTKRPPARPS